jgi:multiple sugar transport system permease protein
VPAGPRRARGRVGRPAVDPVARREGRWNSMAMLRQIEVAAAKRGPRERVPWRKAKWFYIFISPWIVGFLVFTLMPVFSGLFMSLTNFDGMNFQTVRYVGVANYAEAFRDAQAWHGFRRALYLAAVGIPLGMMTSFGAAVLLTREIHGRSLFRTLFYIPSLLPVTAVVWVWKLLMDNNYGLMNGALDAIVPGTYVRWMTLYATQVLILMGLWRSTGQATVIYMAGLQSVPRELDDAAMIDGAGFLARFRFVTVPLVTPVIFYQLITSVIGVGQILVEPILLASGIGSGGGGGLSTIPPRDNYFIMVHVFNRVFTNLRFGYGFALLWLLFAFVLVLTLVVFGTARFWVYYEAEQQ